MQQYTAYWQTLTKKCKKVGAIQTVETWSSYEGSWSLSSIFYDRHKRYDVTKLWGILEPQNVVPFLFTHDCLTHFGILGLRIIRIVPGLIGDTFPTDKPSNDCRSLKFWQSVHALMPMLLLHLWRSSSSNLSRWVDVVMSFQVPAQIFTITNGEITLVCATLVHSQNYDNLLLRDSPMFQSRKIEKPSQKPEGVRNLQQ